MIGISPVVLSPEGIVHRYEVQELAKSGNYTSGSSDTKKLYLVYIGFENVQVIDYEGYNVQVKKNILPFTYSFDIKNVGQMVYTVFIGEKKYYFAYSTT